MTIKEKIRGLFFPSSGDYTYISTKRDVTMLVLTFIVIFLSAFNIRLVLADVIAILAYYFMPKYAYNNEGIWKILGNKKKLFFTWREVKEIDLNGEDIYFVLSNNRVVKIAGVRNAYVVFISLRNKLLAK